ncbi:alpha/beta hydrolase [Pontibacter sp. 172403-2]|uniref:alpha/beta hydrolase n=1 Tax=Pontibacter rufus TaxID=2791028 RepID=UPI0018AFF2BC|nr:alpha/beta hydrolase [Pontibacter sp. 172403-2]MBF9253658.1 alpha/beta hydrolase [Pontibacter sp. 172403-2]
MAIHPKFKYFLLPLLLLCMSLSEVCGQQSRQVIPLYKGKIPNEVPGPDEEKVDKSIDSRYNFEKAHITNVRKPTLTVFLPAKDKANGTAVLICPGGGYAMEAAGHEGYEVAERFAKQGIAAFVLKYRLPDAKVSSQPAIAPLQDAQQGLKLIRENADKWHINPDKVGIMGFSAGGHLAATAGTHFQKSYVNGGKPEANLRPDFMLLIYPVISSDKNIAHLGSFQRLLGENPSAEQLRLFSNELQVTPQTPPTFLIHASDDNVVPVENSIVFYQALVKNKIPAEMHIYQNGGHGFGMHNSTTADDWFESCLNWLRSNDFLGK